MDAPSPAHRAAGAVTAAELLHVVVAVDLAGVLVVVGVATDPKVLGGDGLAGLKPVDVVELGLERRAADASAWHRPLALALIAHPDIAAEL